MGVDRDALERLTHACKRCASCRDWSWHDPRLPGFREGVTRTGFTICPTFKHSPGFESDTPRGRVRLTMGIAEEVLDPSGPVMAKLFDCTCCGNCTAHCPGGRQGKLDPLDVILGARALARDRGAAIPGDLARHLGVPSGTARLPTKWIPSEHRAFGAAASIGFFPGCAGPGIVSRLFPGIANAFLSTLRTAGVSHQTLDDGWCCGYLQYCAGDEAGLAALVERNREAVRGRGVKTLVTSCAGCFHMFSRVYPRVSRGWRESGIDVVHSSQMLARLLQSDAVRFGPGPTETLKVVYHDPCDLGRKGGVYEEPREVLRLIPGVMLLEMEQNRENAFCCGAGSGLKVTNPSLSLEIASDRVRQAAEAGAQCIVSCCPACLWNLGQAVKAQKSVLRVVDLCELVYAAMRTP